MSESYPRCRWQDSGSCQSPLAPLGRRETSPADCQACPVRHHGEDGGSLASARKLLPLRVLPERVHPCLHLGKVIDRLGCGCERRWRRSCDVHGECSLERCASCPDYQPDHPSV